MIVKKVSKYKGVSQLGRCVECGEMETDFHRLYRVQFRGVSIYLCPECFRKLRVTLNEFNLESQTESEGTIGKNVL